MRRRIQPVRRIAQCCSTTRCALASVRRHWCQPTTVPAGMASEPVTGAPITGLYSIFTNYEEGALWVLGVNDLGMPVQPLAPQITDADFTGPIVVDDTDGPGHGWLYSAYASRGLVP